MRRETVPSWGNVGSLSLSLAPEVPACNIGSMPLRTTLTRIMQRFTQAAIKTKADSAEINICFRRIGPLSPVIFDARQPGQTTAPNRHTVALLTRGDNV